MKITILIPLYNGIEYLPEAIESVISQTYTDWQIFIGINGHGEDGGAVGAEAKRIASLDTLGRIHVFIQPPPICNKTLSLNNLVSKVDTEWICLLDADDKWFPEKLSEQIKALEITDAEIIGTKCQYFGNSSLLPDIPSGEISRMTTLSVNPIINSSVMLKKKYAHWNESYYVHNDDYDMWCRLDYKNVKMYNIDKVLVYHRIHSSSSFNTKPFDIKLFQNKFNMLYTKEKATVVTAYYNIKSKFPNSKYIEWIKNLCKIPCNLIIFTDKETDKIISENRPGLPTYTIIKEFNSYDMTSLSMMEFWNNQHRIDPEKSIHSPELYAIWAIKQECVKIAIDINPFSSKWFVWVDIGLLRDTSKIHLYSNFPNNISTICKPNRITFLEIDNIPNNYVELWKSNSNKPMIWPPPDVTLGGGCIAGDITAWEDFSKAYINMLDKFKTRGWFAGKDQIIYFAILIERETKNSFRILHSSQEHGLDRWFSLPVILGGAIEPVVDERFEEPVKEEIKEKPVVEYCLIILNCKLYNNKRLMQKESWLKDFPIQKWYHIQGDPLLHSEYSFDEENHIIYVQCEDDYLSLPKKTYLAMKAIYERFPEIKYIIKTDDDMNYIEGSLEPFLNDIKEYDYGGYLRINCPQGTTIYHINHIGVTDKSPKLFRGTTYATGRIYFVNKKAIEFILPQKQLFWDSFFEDNTVGFALKTMPGLKVFNLKDSHSIFKEF